MDTNAMDINSPEYMQAMAGLMAEALESPDGMRALAAAIAAPIEQEIERKIITPMLLTEHVLPVGEPARYQKKPKVKAYWISKNGEAVESEIAEDEVEFPTHRIHSNPMVDISTLKHGNIGSLIDIQKSAANEIRKEIDKRTIAVMLAAVPPENTVTITGGLLTDDSLAEAMSFLEDREIAIKTIAMRGRRFKDMKGWDLDPQTKLELREKGFIKVYGGADLLTTSAMPLDQILLIPDEEVGKYPVREKLTTDPIDEKRRFKTGWLAWMELGQGVTRPDLLSKIVILP